MILPVYLYGQPVLRKEAEDVPRDYPELKQLVANMFDTMYNADGVGLAAPQVGLSIRLLVIDADVMGDDFLNVKDSSVRWLIRISLKAVKKRFLWKKVV